MASLLGLLTEGTVGQSYIHTVLLGKAKTPVIWELCNACNKHSPKCLDLSFDFLFSFLCSGFFVCLLSVGNCLEGPNLENSNEQFLFTGDTYGTVQISIWS